MALEATIDLTVKKPDFKSMKSEIKELTVAAQQAVMQFGEFSVEAAAAEKKLANARDRMEDFNDRVKAVNPDRFSQINTVVQGVASGFAAAQGAMALFGTDSENLQKTMVKLQGAMALAQGLEGLGKVRQQFGAIFTDVVSGAKKAFAAIRAGIGSTGIGLLVIALGAIVAYWDEIKGAVSGVSSEQKKLLKDTEKTGLANQKALDNISASENILRQQGKTEREILQLKIAATKVAITNLQAQIQTQESIKASQIDAATRNRDILQGLIRFISLPITTLLYAVDQVGKVFGKDFGLEQGFSKGIAEMVFNPKEVKESADKTIQTSKDALLKMQNDVAGFQIAIKGIDKKAAEDKKAQEDKKFADAKKAEEDLQAFYKKSAQDEETFIDEQYAKQKLKAQLEITDAEALAAKLNEIEIARLQNQIQAKKDAGLSSTNLELELAAKTKEISAKSAADRVKDEEDVANAKNMLVNASRDALNALGGLFKQGSAAAKTAALADIAIGTGLGFINALDIAQKGAKATGPAAPFAFPIFYASQIAAVLGAASRAKAILKGGSGGGGGSSAPVSPQGLPQVSAPNVSSSLPSVSGFDTKVFVTEGDIRRTQTRVDSLQKVSVVK